MVMNKLSIEYDTDNEISAVAYTFGKAIEDMINKRTNNLKMANRKLECKILAYSLKTKDDEFNEFFGITCNNK